MKKNINNLFIIIFLLTTSVLTAEVFNKNLKAEELEQIHKNMNSEENNILIRNINYQKNMCLNKNVNKFATQLTDDIEKLSPKYLAEVIQIRPYKGNEDLPQKLEKMLNNVSDYAGIPYYSEKRETWYDLYTWAKIIDETKTETQTIINAEFKMDPFDIVEENITMDKDLQNESILYIATNKNKLNYLQKFDCIWPEKMKICILLFRDGENWVLYGIGGVNAPRIPLFTERIQTSFINRINTFCSYIFNKI